MSRGIRALVVGDSDRDVDRIREELRAGGFDPALERVQTSGELGAALAGEPWDLVLVASSTPASDALTVLASIQASGTDLPVIVVSHALEDAQIIELMRAGARDCIARERMSTLVPVIERELRDAAARREYARELAERRRLELQLRQAQKMEALGRLAGGIAHDFNNLMVAVSGYGERLLERLPAGDPIRHDAEEIRDAAARARALTGQLLTFGRKQVHRPAVIDLSAVVTGIEGMLRRVIGEHIELTTSLEAPEPLVRADRGEIEQVLMNLVVNARDAMPGGGTMRIATSEVTVGTGDAAGLPGIEPGQYIAVEVRDTGHGMDDHTLSHLFEPFFTTKEPGKGTGLGLSTVSGIVTQSGGHVTVTSAVGEGSTFRVLLPRAEQPAARPARRGFASLPRGTETLLLVEDEQGVRELIRDFLARCGYSVIDAPQVSDAIALFDAHQDAVSLLITDVVMPQMNGRVLAERLLERKPTLKVLYMSGYTDDQILVQEVAGGAGFLQKPFTPDVLARKVREVLDGSREGVGDRRAPD